MGILVKPDADGARLGTLPAGGQPTLLRTEDALDLAGILDRSASVLTNAGAFGCMTC